MTKHTKEPWEVNAFDFGEIFQEGHSDIVHCVEGGGEEINKFRHEANAKRIVACVNFCAGFDNKFLKHYETLEEILKVCDGLVEYQKWKANDK